MSSEHDVSKMALWLLDNRCGILVIIIDVLPLASRIPAGGDSFTGRTI